MKKNKEDVVELFAVVCGGTVTGSSTGWSVRISAWR